MADDELLEEDDYVIVEITDDDGNVYNYVQEMIIPVGEENYALLVPLRDDFEEHEDGCDCGCEEEDEVIITKIIEDENGETLYVEPTDEEFDKVQEAYESMFDDEDE